MIEALEIVIADRGDDAADVEALARNELAFPLYLHLGFEVVRQGVRHDDALLIPLSNRRLQKALSKSTTS